MNIQPLTFNDISLIKELQPAGWGDIFPSIEFYTKNNFCFPLKVEIDKKIVGIGTSIIHHDTAWLAHIIVHPDHRNKGIGKLITETLVERLRMENCDTIYLVATDLGAPVYEKVGFETETVYLFFKDIKNDPGWITSKNITAYTNDLKTELAELDLQVSGEDRMFHIEQYLEGSYLYKKGNAIEGFYLPGFGEGLIVAITPSAGIELMKLRFATRDTAVFPAENLHAATFMHENHYTEFRTAKRMRLGRKRNWEPEHIYGRIGGNLG